MFRFRYALPGFKLGIADEINTLLSKPAPVNYA